LCKVSVKKKKIDFEEIFSLVVKYSLKIECL